MKYNPGSIEESLAIEALKTEREAEYLKTLALINATIQLGNSLKAALGMDVGQSASGDTLRKNLDGLKTLLLPHLSEDTEKKAQKIRKILEQEVAKGPLKYTVVGGPNKRERRKKGR